MVGLFSDSGGGGFVGVVIRASFDLDQDGVLILLCCLKGRCKLEGVFGDDMVIMVFGGDYGSWI